MVSHRPNCNYQRRDLEVVDYELYPLDEGSDLWCRGPAPEALKKKSYVVCLGAAQTFGCFCDSPYPRLIQQSLDMPVVNLGFGGAHPHHV